MAAPKWRGTHVSAQKRLLELPPVFNSVDLSTQFGPAALASARVVLTRWVRDGLIQPVTARAGVFLNLVKLRAAASGAVFDGTAEDLQHQDPAVWRPWLESAVARAFPSSVRIGTGVLHEAGWITQIPRYLSVAVARDSSGARARPHAGIAEHLRLVPRPASWYAAVHDGRGVMALEGRRAPMMSLTPSWALADAIVFGVGAGQRLGLGADDLDLDAMDTEARAALSDAIHALGRVAQVALPERLVGGSIDWNDDDELLDRVQEAIDGVALRRLPKAPHTG